MRSACLKMTLMFLTVCFAQRSFAVDLTLNVGDPAPLFVVQDDTGKEWNAADHYGKKILVVYFYPADMTGGCTKQACGFRDDLSQLQDQGVEVVGVSGDTVRNHQLFKKAYQLNFALLADPEGVVATAFGVPFTRKESTVTAVIDGVEEKLTRGGTAKRWTFVVGTDGKIAYKNEQVAAAQDSQTIAEFIRTLKAASQQ